MQAAFARILSLFTLALGVLVVPANGDEHSKLVVPVKHGEKADLVLIRTDGTELKNLTANPAGDSSPSWSPDGKKIVFESDRDGSRNVYVMDADGSSVRQLTRGKGIDVAPDWSPDGKKILFVSDRTGNAEVFVMDVDGGNPVNLTNDAAFDADPSWSPGGDRILFVSNRGDGGGFRLYLMDANGGNPRIVPALESGFGWIFSGWAPDGKRLVYADGPLDSIEIWTCAVDGTAKKKLTALGGINTFPSWAPDGKQVAFVHYEKGTNPDDSSGSLWMTDPDGASQNRIGGAGVSVSGRPSWMPGK